MADDLELLADVEVLSEHGLHPSPSFLDLLEQRSGEVLEPEPLEVADEPEEDAGEEVDGAAVHPRRHLEGAREDVAEDVVGEEGDAVGGGGVPPGLVGGLGGEAGRDEGGQEAEGEGEARGVVEPDAVALAPELVEVEQAAEPDAAEGGGEAEEPRRRGGRERELHDGGEGPAGGPEGEEEVRGGRDDDGEDEEEEPGERGLRWARRVVHAHPPQAGAEPLQLVVGARRAPLE